MLDQEIEGLLRAYLDRLCAHAGPSMQAELRPELGAMLRAALWLLSVGTGAASTGQTLQNLHVAAALEVLAS